MALDFASALLWLTGTHWTRYRSICTIALQLHPRYCSSMAGRDAVLCMLGDHLSRIFCTETVRSLSRSVLRTFLILRGCTPVAFEMEGDLSCAVLPRLLVFTLRTMSVSYADITSRFLSLLSIWPRLQSGISPWISWSSLSADVLLSQLVFFRFISPAMRLDCTYTCFVRWQLWIISQRFWQEGCSFGGV